MYHEGFKERHMTIQVLDKSSAVGPTGEEAERIRKVTVEAAQKLGHKMAMGERSQLLIFGPSDVVKPEKV
jgi:hypothetical protein